MKLATGQVWHPTNCSRIWPREILEISHQGYLLEISHQGYLQLWIKYRTNARGLVSECRETSFQSWIKKWAAEVKGVA